MIRPPKKYEELIDLVVATITGKPGSTRKYSLYDFQEMCTKYKGIIVLLLDEARDLILKRITKTGGAGLGPFTETAAKKIFDLSYGIPREILKTCDWAIAQANKNSIDISDIEQYRGG
ncbi:MAG: hypothetical protein U9R38_05400 [Candidatus Margulisiibacteriota bacterium]|nr:hypothetical protein [Candidatus Margulisiibacteriota bacterium]